jgi:hypothetical protein
MKIIWKIEKLNRRESDGYVTVANVKVYVDDGIGNNFTELACSWPDGKLETPYEQLTQDEVLTWVFQSVDKTLIEKNLILQPTKPEKIVSGLPW